MPGHAALGDHLSSALSCSVSSTVLALHDTEGFYILSSDILCVFFYIGDSKNHFSHVSVTLLDPNQFLCIKFAVVNAGF